MFTTERLIIPKSEKKVLRRRRERQEIILGCSCYTTALRKNLSTTKKSEELAISNLKQTL